MDADGRCDYVVVGSGSAGAVVAARLSEDPDVSVTLLEAGPADSSLMIAMPAAVGMLIASGRYNWNYVTEPQQNLDGRRLAVPRGRVLGGSSSLNGMIYVRGHGLDYDRWVEEGAVGWSYGEVLPYFRRAERHETRVDDYHGRSGPIGVVTGSQSNPLYDAFIEAGIAAGYGRTPDVNGCRQEGFGRFDMNIDGGRRASTSAAYLPAARRRANLKVITSAVANRVLIEHGRATGVTYVAKGRQRKVMAAREVIVSAGAIDSPKLLMLSGIGPADELRRHGIDVVADLRGVGRNLQDHLEIHVEHSCLQPITLYGDLKPWNRLLIGARWLLTRDGKGATNHYEAGAFVKSTEDTRHPDIQFHFVPIAYADHQARRATNHGYRVHVGPLRSKSLGRVTLASAQAADPPRIDPDYMSTPDDWRTMRQCLAIARDVFGQPSFAPFRGPEIMPGPGVRTENEIDRFIRATAVSSYHHCGTCRMGVDGDAVVDPKCRVRGVEGLRVVDASIMPSIVSGNLNAPTVMIGEKAADMIAGKEQLPRSNATFAT
jgi:choline dehydrogenase